MPGKASGAGPLFSQGTERSCGNTNDPLLSIIAERVTGANLADLVCSPFFESLTLSDPHLWEGETRPSTVDGSRLACGYPGGPKRVKRPGFEIVPVPEGFDWKVARAAGGWFRPRPIWLCWIDEPAGREVLDPGHRRVVTRPMPQSIEALAGSPSFGAVRWTWGSLGLLRHGIDGQGTGWGHGGSINGFVSIVVRIDESGQTVSVTSNLLQTSGFAALGELVIAANEAARP